ncbi:hypothetical protein MRX96_010584 [Rhipicephalus microplus]
MRGNRGSQFSCIVAVVKKALADKEEAAIVSLLKYGFSRWLTETCSHGVCLNEMIQIEHNDLANLRKLEASEALFSALHFTRDGVIVTGPSHDVQFMNHAAERLVGYTAEELLGENAQELHRTGALKAEVAECIIAEVYKGHAWQGTLFQRRRSGECVPVWSKIAPVNITGPGESWEAQLSKAETWVGVRMEGRSRGVDVTSRLLHNEGQSRGNLLLGDGRKRSWTAR